VVRQPILGVRQPPSESDVLGPEIPADGLTVTVSVGLEPVRRSVRSGGLQTGEATRADARLARHPGIGASSSSSCGIMCIKGH
jgi:hypothetical protein